MVVAVATAVAVAVAATALAARRVVVAATEVQLCFVFILGEECAPSYTQCMYTVHMIVHIRIQLLNNN